MKQRTAVIITGNPEHTRNNPRAQEFYRSLEAYLVKLGYKVRIDPGEPYTVPPLADLWVGHSRGAGRLMFAPKGTRTLALGTAEGLHHPQDNSLRDFDAVPNDYHYVLTPEMKAALADTTANRYGDGKTAALQDLGVVT